MRRGGLPKKMHPEEDDNPLQDQELYADAGYGYIDNEDQFAQKKRKRKNKRQAIAEPQLQNNFNNGYG